MKLQTIIRVVGIGGAGGNAIDRMMQCKLAGIELMAVNTDVQDLKKIRAHKKIHIGKQSTRGLGAGMNPELGRRAALENKQELEELLVGSDLVFLAAGLGGGTGGGAIVPIAEIAKAKGALVIGVVTTPFVFEGSMRMRLAQNALRNLAGKLDTLLTIPNDQILKIISPQTTVVSAFWQADEVLREAVQGISDLITKTGIINVDFASLRSIMKNSGKAVFGVGQAKGEKRMELALNMAFHSPLLNISPKGAKGVLFSVAGGEDLTLAEIQEAAQAIRKEVSPHARIIFGASYDKTLKPGEVKITVIATGFENE